MKNRFKKLPLSFPYNVDPANDQFGFWDDIKCIDNIETVQLGDGIYYDRLLQKCWVQAFGRICEYNLETFKYNLENLNHVWLRKDECDAIVLLIKNKTIKRWGNPLAERLYKQIELQQLRNTSRNARLYTMKIFKNQ